MKNLEKMGVQEMNSQEMQTIDGGDGGLTIFLIGFLIGFTFTFFGSDERSERREARREARQNS